MLLSLLRAYRVRARGLGPNEIALGVLSSTGGVTIDFSPRTTGNKAATQKYLESSCGPSLQVVLHFSVWMESLNVSFN